VLYLPAMRQVYLFFVCCILLPAASLAAESDDREPAPRFHAKTLEGEQFTNASVKGKVVLFQFWTTWCQYCKSEESLVNDITTEFATRDSSYSPWMLPSPKRRCWST
jgi:thiol-disulfide isomerase/thioredoxin